jgi:hypothetical protein
MRRLTYYILGFIGAIALISCTEEVSELKQEGNPMLQIENQFSNVHFGDNLPFTVSVSDDIPLSTLTAILYFGEEEVKRTTIRTRENGEYSGIIEVPFLKDIPDGTATLEFVLLNTTLKSATQTFEVPVTRAPYPYLMLVTADATYPMLPTGQPYEYAATEPFPSTDLPAYIKTPVVDEKGREIVFGWDAGAVTQDVTENIPFVSPVGGTFTVSFNTKTYQAAPFFEILLNGEKMTMVDKENYVIDVDLTKGQELTIEGIGDIAEWWIDKDYLTEIEAGKYIFTPITAKYRIMANLTLKYFRIEALDGNEPASLNADGTGAIWIIGDQVGKPSYTNNHVGWDPSNALCMAPIGNKTYQVTLVAGESVNADEINFKFFHQKNWGGEFSSSTLTTGSDIVFIGNGTNGRDDGNLGLISGTTLEAGATYVFTVDLSAGIDKGVLRVLKM